MALSLATVTPLSFHAPTPTRAARSTVRMETVKDLEVLAGKLNPAVGYYNPTSLAEMEFWGQTQEATIGFLRASEIKHGRVAMAAFVGFCVQAQGIHFPWDLTLSGVSFGDISAAGSPLEQWDALPTTSKLSLFLSLGFLEWWGENAYALDKSGEKHYMRGGKPGFYPSFNKGGIPHPVPLELFDPFGLSKNASPEKKEKGLLAEINNGRLAMLGIMAFVSEAKVPGSVPALKGLIPQYAGNPMGPFTAADNLPYVSDMLNGPFAF
jgi:hypothetical protein